jgi:hypothetical protein
MHCLLAELVVGPLVLHVVCAGESIHVSHFLVGAHCTSVPILYVKPAGETNILVCPLLDHIGILRILMLRGLHAGRDIGNHLVATNKRDGGSLLGWPAWVGVAASIAGESNFTTATTRLTPLLSGCLDGDSLGDEVALCCSLGPPGLLAR